MFLCRSLALFLSLGRSADNRLWYFSSFQALLLFNHHVEGKAVPTKEKSLMILNQKQIFIARFCCEETSSAISSSDGETRRLAKVFLSFTFISLARGENMQKLEDERKERTENNEIIISQLWKFFRLMEIKTGSSWQKARKRTFRFTLLNLCKISR